MIGRPFYYGRMGLLLGLELRRLHGQVIFGAWRCFSSTFHCKILVGERLFPPPLGREDLQSSTVLFWGQLIVREVSGPFSSTVPACQSFGQMSEGTGLQHGLRVTRKSLRSFARVPVFGHVSLCRALPMRVRKTLMAAWLKHKDELSTSRAGGRFLCLAR